MRTEIKMPSNISNLEDFKKWVNSFNKEGQDLDVRMKRRPNFTPQNLQDHNGIITYQITDGISSGQCTIKRFNQVFKFEVVSYK